MKKRKNMYNEWHSARNTASLLNPLNLFMGFPFCLLPPSIAAFSRNVQVMCESVQKLPSDWKNAYPETEWSNIAGFRNRLTHEYLSVDLDIVWNVIENYLPDLEKRLKQWQKNFGMFR